MDLDSFLKAGDITLKFVQSGVLITGAVLGTLTYKAARRGLLNTIHTEYYKRVIDRLSIVIDELASEYDPSSENFWLKVNR